MLTRMRETPKGGRQARSTDRRVPAEARRARKSSGAPPDLAQQANGSAVASAREPSASSGVLAELPRARPQRATPRRSSARKATAHSAGKRRGAGAGADRRTAAVEGSAGAGAGPTILAGLPRVRPQHTSPRRAAARAARSRGGTRSTEQSVPRQGFESEPRRMSEPIQPPGGAELAVSLGELAGELAKVGIATGARLLKDIVSRLPG